tara:strand:- start:759 stop:1925 length:1167 start_codon:yes stop_codon:yes gene_type:complete
MPYIGRSLGDGVRARYIYAATSGQTTFSGNDANGIALAYTDTLYMDVYQNGVLLKPVTDYASTTGTSVVLVTGASTDDVVEMIVYDSFAVADTVSAANGGTFSGNMAMGGTLGVTGAATLSSTLAVTDDANFDSGTLFVDASANRVGIGTTSPSQLLSIFDSGSARMEIKSGTSGTSIIDMGDTDDADIAGIRYSHADNDMTFRANNDVRMTIDSSGALLVHTSSRSGSSNFVVEADTSSENPMSVVNTRSSASTDYHIIMYRNGNIVGSVQTSLSATSFVTSSDYRLKENVTDITDATDRLKKLNPVKFNFISDADTTLDGFLAHEVQSIVPEAVTGTKDATEKYTDEEGKEQTRIVPQGIDQAKLVPLLVKTIQELEARITALESA